MTRPLSAPRSIAAMLRVATMLVPFSTRVGCRHAAIDVEDVAGTLAGAHRRGEERYGLRNILRQDVDPQRGALAIDFFQLIGCHAIGGGAFLSPRAVPDARPCQHSVWIDGIDANAELTALLGQAACQVRFGGFSC